MRYWRFSSGRWSGLKRQWVSDIPPPHPPTQKYFKKDIKNVPGDRAQELCESGGGRPGLPLPNSPYGLCGRKATLNLIPSNELSTKQGGNISIKQFPRTGCLLSSKILNRPSALRPINPPPPPPQKQNKKKLIIINIITVVVHISLLSHFKQHS